MEDLRPNAKRAKYAITFIWIVMVLEIVSLVSGYFQYELLQRMTDSGDFSMEEANANDLREQIVGIVYAVAYLISAITFIQWFRRAYYNLHIKETYLSFTEGWAAGSWFTPIVCLYRPYQIMKELYEETGNILSKNGISTQNEISTRFLGWWWTLWIISSLLGQFVFRYTLKAETAEELTTSTVAGMIGNIIGIPLALITIKIIMDYAQVEPLLHEVKDETEITPPDDTLISG